MNERRTAALVAEFDDPTLLLAAARQLTAAGYVYVEAYGPVDVPELAEALGQRPPRRLATWSFAAALVGGLGMFAFESWAMAVDWPLDVGGRAPLSWPAFIVPAFECMILAASLTAVIALLSYADLVRPHHPVFELAVFERASDDRFFLAVERDDPSFDLVETRALLERLEPLEVHELRD